MPFGLLIIAVQIAFAVHVIRTGRQIFWIFLIVFVPLIGCLVYFFAEIMPELGNSRTARRAASTVMRPITSERDFQAMIRAVEDTPDRKSVV